MKFAAVSVLLASLVSAIPTAENANIIPEAWKRSMEANLNHVRRSTALTDTQILNFALTLEHLENTFYRQGLKMFSMSDFTAAGYSPALRTNIGESGRDEKTHVETLAGALGKMAVPPCVYDFGLTDVESFVETAAILEGVGVTAYLGAAALIHDPTYLTIAGSILTVESRHSSYLRSGQSPEEAPYPQPFDVPLDVAEVYTLASAFITSCPKKADLGITPFPMLALASGQKMPKRAGKTVDFDIEMPTTVMSGSVYAAFLTVLGPIFTPVEVPSAQNGSRVSITIPKGVAGQSYVVLSSSGSDASDSNIIAGPGIVSVQAPYTYKGFPM